MISDTEVEMETEELGQEQENEAENDGNLVERDENDANDNVTNAVQVKPKRIVRNPQPKLNEETIKGPKGIAILEKYFERVPFKGRGYEEEDLNIIMKTYEHWCHRLFPKFPFDDCVARLEKLGTKKAVLTHIKRIRYDLLVEDKPIESDSEDEIATDGFVNMENTSQIPIVSQIESTLTEEQLQKIRENKEKAQQLRQEKLRNLRIRAEGYLEPSSSLPSVINSNSINSENQNAVEETFTPSENAEIIANSSLERRFNNNTEVNEVIKCSSFQDELESQAKEDGSTRPNYNSNEEKEMSINTESVGTHGSTNRNGLVSEVPDNQGDNCDNGYNDGHFKDKCTLSHGNDENNEMDNSILEEHI